MPAEIITTVADGGLGFRGPDGPMTWAAFGVASEAEALADQEPIVITSPEDAELLLGTGPLRDLLVLALTGTGTTVVALPLQRSAGGTVLGIAARTSGTLAVTAVAGHSLGMENVVMRWAVGGAGGTAALQLIVNGVEYPQWVPDAADYSSPLTIPAASLGPLANGVAAADQFMPTVTAPTAAVVGDSVTFDFGEPAYASSDIATAVDKLGEHPRGWRFCIPAGFMSPANWTAFDTAIRLLPNSGRYVRGLVQLAGPALVSGATAAQTTAVWNSAQATLAGTPARVGNPRTGAVTTWMSVADPTQNRDRVLPATYALAAAMSARQSWEHPDATKYGPLVTDPRTRVKLLNVKAIHPADITFAQIRSQDEIWLTTIRKYSGRNGIYPTHVRLWGQYPDTSRGTTGSDFIGIERGFLIDEICADVDNRLFESLNDRVETGADGRISPAARDALSAIAQGAIDPFISVNAIAAGEVVVTDKDPGILQTSTTRTRLRVQPYGKNERIEVDVGYAAGLNVTVSEEVAA